MLQSISIINLYTFMEETNNQPSKTTGPIPNTMCTNCNGMQMCMCGSGRNGYNGFGRRFFFLRLVVGFLLLMAVFFVGVKVGELTGYIRDNSYQNMRRMQSYTPGTNMRVYGNSGMMDNSGTTNIPSMTAPATPQAAQ